MALRGQIATFKKVSVVKGETVHLLNVTGKGILKTVGLTYYQYGGFRFTIDGQTTEFTGDNMSNILGASTGIWSITDSYRVHLVLNLPFTTGFSIEAYLLASANVASTDVYGSTIWAVEV